MKKIERYKILAAILAIGEFTSEELAKMSDVKLSYVRNVIAGERKKYLKNIGKKNSGRRGGQFNLYRIKKEKINLIQSEIDALFKQICENINDNDETKQTQDISLSLLVAKDIILEILYNTDSLYEINRLPS